jgi:hypothetical protein
LVPYARTAEFDALCAFLAAGDDPGDVVAPPEADGDPQRRFRDAYAFAVACRQRRAPAAFLAHLERLRRATDRGAWIALVGLCHGVFQDDHSDARANEACAALVEIL